MTVQTRMRGLRIASEDDDTVLNLEPIQGLWTEEPRLFRTHRDTFRAGGAGFLRGWTLDCLGSNRSSRTLINRNYFAGLLEMFIPVAFFTFVGHLWPCLCQKKNKPRIPRIERIEIR